MEDQEGDEIQSNDEAFSLESIEGDPDDEEDN